MSQHFSLARFSFSVVFLLSFLVGCAADEAVYVAPEELSTGDDKVIEVASVSLNKAELRLEVGSVETLVATVMPADATHKQLSWTSSNPAVAMVDAHGQVAALNPGSANIVAAAQEGGKTAACKLTVVAANTETADAPSIEGFSPLEAPFGASLTILGKNFSAIPEENSVTLNGVPARVSSATPEEIHIEVPKNMRSSGLLRVSVAGKTAVASPEFVYVPTTTVSTLAGSGAVGLGAGDFADGPGNVARFNSPRGLSIDVAGNLYVADTGNHRIRKITPEGSVSTLAGSEQGWVDGHGDIAQFNSPYGITIDMAGILYVADNGNRRIRRITPAGTVNTFAWSTKDEMGWEVPFAGPTGIVADAEGNLYVLDSHGLYGNIHKIAPTGVARIWVMELYGLSSMSGPMAPRGLTIDAAGNLYVAGDGINKISPQGEVSTFVGNALFVAPTGIALEAKTGNLYMTDTYIYVQSGSVNVAQRIYRISPETEIVAVAGNGMPSYNTSGGGFADGPANIALFDNPQGIAIDAAGTLYVADTWNHRIRKIVTE